MGERLTGTRGRDWIRLKKYAALLKPVAYEAEFALDIGQGVGSEVILVQPKYLSAYRQWAGHSPVWVSESEKLTYYFHQFPYGTFIDTRSYASLLGELLPEPSEELAGDLQTFALPESPANDRPSREFSVYQAIWLAVSEPLRSIRYEKAGTLILGGATAAVVWLLGGFTALVISAIALAGLNSIVSVFTDLKEGRFSATRLLSALGQFPVFLLFIALGRLADYGIADERIVVVRSFMAAIVIAVCFWRSFRGLVFLADLEGLDELIDREIDTFWDWVSQRRQRRTGSLR
jgi:hypothetical protein